MSGIDCWVKMRLWCVCVSRHSRGTSTARTRARPSGCVVDERRLREDAVEGERGPAVLPVDHERALGAHGAGEIEVAARVGVEGQVDLEGVEARDALRAAEADHARALGQRGGALS